MLTDIEISNNCNLRPIGEIAKKLGVPEEDLDCYGKYKAKIRARSECGGKLVLVTAINPTSLGEGKTTVSIGIADGLSRAGAKVALALREPSLGPVFGIKGGAAGGGYAQIVPMEDINLHFNGDMHAITAANNLLAAMLDNHIHFGNKLRINPARVQWKRCLDLNDRVLRSTVVGLGGEKDGTARQDGFDITAASEIMAILCLSENLKDLKRRLGNILVAYDYDDKPVYCRDLNAADAMAILLKDAIKPNLVQTLEGTPAIVHGGPFANIAHGCNSIIATKTALSLADVVVTEAGFGADLGAEKFLDIKCRTAGIFPDLVVVVATVKALKLNGGAPASEIKKENIDALRKGMCNLEKHVENMKEIYGLRTVVAVNRFDTDTDAEIEEIRKACARLHTLAFDTKVFAEGGAGAEGICAEILRLLKEPATPAKFCYGLEEGIEDKLRHVVRRVYGGAEISLSDKAKKEIARIEANGFQNLPVIIAKTQYSLSDNPALLGRPEGFPFKIRDVVVRSGAGFVVAIAGDMMLMPGLPVVPAAERMTIDDEGNIKGLF